MKKKIAIIGATGVVGRTVLKILKERELLENRLSLFASKSSAGKSIYVGKRRFRIKELTTENLHKTHFDFALFCTKETISEQYVKPLAEKGTIVIDFSSLYRHEYPLIIPEINMEKAQGNILCNPNCSTAAAVMALYEIHNKFGLKKIIYSTYQAVSGAGKHALNDMKQSNHKKLKKLDFPILNNLIPYIGKIAESGYSTEENKMIYETQKILDDKNIKISATCVRVPIDIGHSISINFETRKEATLDEIKNTLRSTKGVKVFDDFNIYPMPLFAKGQDDVLVGRIRNGESKNTFNIFVSSDNLRKGAAQNGVQILEELLKEKI